MTLHRRAFIKQTGLALSFTVAGKALLLTPREAYAKKMAFSVLSAEEASVLEAICDHLLPGAKVDGVAHFVDWNLSQAPNDCSLFIKWFNVPPPYAGFYKAALAVLDEVSYSTYQKDITGLNKTEAGRLIESLRDGKIPGWYGPSAPLAYHILRNDAVDVVYGTMEGFDNLGIPYLAHIEPPRTWLDE